ncbi:MAG: SusD/RagB family nutrient-binding outer membrane lipoprotein [Balneolaceae bacterium]
MKPFKKAALFTVMTLLLLSCDDFGSVNDDPNNPAEVSTELLLTSAQRDMGDVVGAFMGTLWVQYIGETQYTDDQEYRNTNADFNAWYTGPLQDLENIIRLNSDEETRDEVAQSGGSNNNQIAVARILRAYFYHMMTDRWGMIPYSEALQGRENFQPAYDSQDEIYADLLTELNEAADQIDDGDPVSGDILMDGNMVMWEQFANSLRARIALRLSEVDETLAEAEFSDAIDSGIIEENIMYPFLADADNENPWYTRFRTRTDYAIHETIADYMKDLEDQRLTRYALPAPDEDQEDGVVTLDEIVGMPFLENAGDLSNSAISFPGSAIGAGGPGVGQQDASLPIITTAELHFAMAEAVERGWIEGDADELYYSGIEDSWQQWGVFNADDLDDYTAQAEVAYNAAEWDEKIGNQKWLALFPNGYQAWAEWRRLGFPELDPNPHAPGSSPDIPLRVTYPTTEANINGANYQAAIDEQGEDSPYTPLWWDE